MSFDGELNLGAVHRRLNFSVQLALPTKSDFIKSWRIFSFYFLQKCLQNCKKNLQKCLQNCKKIIYRNVYKTVKKNYRNVYKTVKKNVQKC